LLNCKQARLSSQEIGSRDKKWRRFQIDFYGGGLEAKMSPFVIRCVKECKRCTLDFIAGEPEVALSEEKTWAVDPTVFVSTETFGVAPPQSA
jgi:hypothetical protein